MTYYELWQLEKKGNILEGSDRQPEEIEKPETGEPDQTEQNQQA